VAFHDFYFHAVTSSVVLWFYYTALFIRINATW